MEKKTAMKGRYLMLFVNGKYLPLATSCTLNESYNMVDGETKDDSIYQHPDFDTRQWSIDFECQLDTDDETFAALQAIHKGTAVVPVIFGKATNAADTDIPETGWTTPTAGPAQKGNAYLNTLKVDGPVSGKATISGTFTGTGELTDVEEAA